MKKYIFLLVLLTVALSTCAFGATEFWLTDRADGTKLAGDALTIDPGAEFTLWAFLNTDMAGTVFEAFAGWDKSNTAMGTGAATGLTGFLSLVSTTAEIQTSIASAFDVGRSAVLAQAREANNAAYAGRPYGVKVVGGYAGAKTIPETALFSFTLKNNLAAGESWAAVLSDNGSGASYTTAWKNGTTAYRDSYVLAINSTPEAVIPEPASMLALGSGVVALFGFVRRRRS